MTRLTRALLVPALAAASVWTCGDNGVEPSAIGAVQVTSSAGSLFDVGGSVQLAAAATDPDGNAVSGVTFSWSSTDSDIVTVSTSGMIEAKSIGAATIRAEAGGRSGSLAVVVVDADADGISAFATDAFVGALVLATSSDLRTRLQAAAGNCETGADQGYLEAVQSCIAAVRAEVSGVTDSNDRVVLAVLALFVDEIERRLNL